jgi:hypothetical protein
MVTATFDKWFDGLTAGEQEKLISHILNKQIGTPMMEGLFSGPHGKMDKGIFSGPAGEIGARICGSCGRPL